MSAKILNNLGAERSQKGRHVSMYTPSFHHIPSMFLSLLGALVEGGMHSLYRFLLEEPLDQAG